MGEVRVNLTNFIAVGLMAFTFVWVANKAMDKFGLAQFKA